MLKTTLTMSGPFFTRDPRKTWAKNVDDLMADIAKQGQADVRSQWPVLTGAGRAGTRGFVQQKGGQPVAVVAALHVYPWPGNSSGQYRGGKVERKRHMFRRTAGRIGKRVKVDLLKGLQ